MKCLNNEQYWIMSSVYTSFFLVLSASLKICILELFTESGMYFKYSTSQPQTKLLAHLASITFNKPSIPQIHADGQMNCIMCTYDSSA